MAAAPLESIPGLTLLTMEEDEEDRVARLAREKEEKQLHKLTKLAHALRMDIKVIKDMEEKSRRGKKELRLGARTKEVSWRRRGLLKIEVEKLLDVLSFQRVCGRESILNIDLRVCVTHKAELICAVL